MPLGDFIRNAYRCGKSQEEASGKNPIRAEEAGEEAGWASEKWEEVRAGVVHKAQPRDGSQEGEGQRRQLQDAGTGDTGPGARPALERGCQGPKNEKPVREAAQGLVELGPRAGRSRQEATGCFGQLFCASVYSSVRCAAYALL